MPARAISPYLARLRERLHPSRVRLRLTVLCGGLFILSGAVLLGITYLLVSGSPVNRFQVHTHGSRGTPGRYVFSRPSSQTTVGRALRDQAAQQHQEELHHLLVQSGIALAIMVVISVVLGWVVAGRILRPLRTMTSTIQKISARNVHERLAVAGPRDEMKDLSDTVDGLLERLETTLDAQRRFVANAAHELRTPLTLQHALLEETLIDRNVTLESFRSTFERLLTLGQHQTRLLESLLTLASSERGLDRREPVDLATTAEQALHAARAELDRRELSAELDIEPARLCGDPALVERLVANLIDNAIGYNVAGGSVTVTTATRDGKAVVGVSNTGARVPAEQVDRLFQPFERLDRAAGGEEHHGLGLSIVRAIATAHDGSIAARARDEGGLTVEVAFPSAPVPAPVGGRRSLAGT